MPVVAPPWPGAVRPSPLGPGRRPARGERRQRLPWRAEHEGRPGAGRALYRGRRLRQEAGGGEGGATQLPGEGGGSAPGGHGAQPAAALTLAAPHPRPGPGLGLLSEFAGPAPPSAAPLGPFSTGTPPPQTWGKVSQLRAGREERARPRASVAAFPLGPQFRQSQALPGLNRAQNSPAVRCPPDPSPRLARRASRPVT